MAMRQLVNRLPALPVQVVAHTTLSMWELLHRRLWEPTHYPMMHTFMHQGLDIVTVEQVV